MLKLFRNEKGFTLVELMIVVVIVGILAAVAIPMYRGSTDRAKASEAVAALGSIRSAMRVYHAENASYAHAKFADNTNILVDEDGVEPGTAGWGPAVIDLDTTDLKGRYFDYHCYTFVGVPTVTAFKIEADGDTTHNKATKAVDVTHILRSIDEDGNITKK